MREMAAEEKATGVATLETGTEMPGDGIQLHGDRANVVDSYRVSRRPPLTQQPQGAGSVWCDGQPHQWLTEVRRDSGGWRLWSVTIPAAAVKNRLKKMKMQYRHGLIDGYLTGTGPLPPAPTRP
jgi:hypothetical protein